MQCSRICVDMEKFTHTHTHTHTHTGDSGVLENSCWSLKSEEPGVSYSQMEVINVPRVCLDSFGKDFELSLLYQSKTTCLSGHWCAVTDAYGSNEFSVKVIACVGDSQIILTWLCCTQFYFDFLVSTIARPMYHFADIIGKYWPTAGIPVLAYMFSSKC